MSTRLSCVIAAAVVSLAAAEPRASLWLVVPQTGRPGVLAVRGASALEDAGFDVGSLRTGKAPRVLIVYPRAVMDEAALNTVLEMVREGAGLVVVYTLSADVAECQAELLKPWGVELEPAERGTGQTDAIPHPITRGIEKLVTWRIAATLHGAQPLLVQGDNVIAAAADGSMGRLVVLPLDALVPGQQTDPIPPPNLRLLVQAAKWAGRVEEQVAVSQDAGGDSQPPGGSGEPQPAAEAEEPPIPELTVPAAGARGRFSPVAALDIAASDEGWPAIRDAVAKLVSALGLKPQDVPKPERPSSRGRGSAEEAMAETVGEDATRLPLFRALQDDPALVVVGSCREFADVEELALATYVDSGGAALFLPRGTDKTNVRLVELNGVLAKFGMGALLGRPAGPVQMDAGRILADVVAPKQLPAGVTVIGHRGLDLIMVGNMAVLRVVQSGAGRVAVADPLPLTASKPDSSLPDQWQKILEAVLRWLLEGMEFGA